MGTHIHLVRPSTINRFRYPLFCHCVNGGCGPVLADSTETAGDTRCHHVWVYHRVLGGMCHIAGLGNWSARGGHSGARCRTLI
ncbi:hypothetical protein TELCIR_18126 [Teladorsagia circumcincta]|uniref:Uncharacterized protein n=1 Tax=Teladorsagia circumcincta TaxID=45464 RepID=A0A2G9TR15_TELCI|nr:hypothetical protein TELCIR_18126 [Teladorsagia circumcincta]